MTRELPGFFPSVFTYEGATVMLERVNVYGLERGVQRRLNIRSIL